MVSFFNNLLSSETTASDGSGGDNTSGTSGSSTTGSSDSGNFKPDRNGSGFIPSELPKPVAGGSEAASGTGAQHEGERSRKLGEKSADKESELSPESNGTYEERHRVIRDQANLAGIKITADALNAGAVLLEHGALDARLATVGAVQKTMGNDYAQIMENKMAALAMLANSQGNMTTAIIGGHEAGFANLGGLPSPANGPSVQQTQQGFASVIR